MAPSIMPRFQLTIPMIQEAKRAGMKVWINGRVAAISSRKPSAPGFILVSIPAKTEPVDAA